MPDEPLPKSIADLPAQRASVPKSKAEARARYFNTGNAFNLQLPRVPDESFTAEPARALHPDTPTGLIACDRSRELQCAFPATTPLVLARYARIRTGETLETTFAASGVVVYVIAGSGSTECGSERLEWNSGDNGMGRSRARDTCSARRLSSSQYRNSCREIRSASLHERKAQWFLSLPATQFVSRHDGT